MTPLLVGGIAHLAILLVSDPIQVEANIADKMLYDAYVYCQKGLVSQCRTLAERTRSVAPLERQRLVAMQLARSAEWRGGQILDRVGRRNPGFQQRSHQLAVAYLRWLSLSSNAPAFDAATITYGWRTRQVGRRFGFQVEGGPLVGGNYEGVVAGGLVRALALHSIYGTSSTGSVEMQGGLGCRGYKPRDLEADVAFVAEWGFVAHTGRLSWGASVVGGPTVRADFLLGGHVRIGLAI